MDKLTTKIVKTVKEAYKEKQPKDESATPEAATSSSAMGFSHSELHALDDKGLGMIHHAIINANTKVIERCVRADESVLEMRTGDELYRTPLLLAVAHGNLEVIKCLVNLGCDMTTLDGDSHSVVDICVLNENVRVLDFLIEVDSKELKVFESIIKLFNSDDEDEVISSAKILFALTQGTADGINGNWERVHNAGGVSAIVKVLAPKQAGSMSTTVTRSHALRVLLNMISKEPVKMKLQEAGGLTILVEQLKPPHNEDAVLVQFCAWVIKEVTRIATVIDSHAEELWAAQVVPQMIRLIPTLSSEPEALTEVLHAIGNFAEVSEGRFRESIGSLPATFESLIVVLNETTTKAVLLSAAATASKIMKGNEANQKCFVQEGGVPSIVRLLRVKNKEIQVCAVRAIQALAENNAATQRAVLEEGAAAPLLQLLKKSRGAATLVATATTLWALAGENTDDKRTVAELIGVSTLIEFLASMSDKLHLIGAQGLSMLCYGPQGKQDEIGEANGVHPLVRLLRSSKEYIVIAALDTVRNLCIQTALRPHVKNQNTVAANRGIRLLINLIIRQSTPKHSSLVQVEAAKTLAAAVLGNNTNIKQLYDSSGFSMVNVMELMYHEEEQVRALAGSALSLFAYNNLHQQKVIASLGGIPFGYFEPFLESEDELIRGAAAEQLVILAKVIPDEEEATSSAIGLKLIADILNESLSEVVLATAAESVARLAHMRAGVAHALGSINMVDSLANLLLSESDFLRAPSAVALGFMSTVPVLERSLLQRCRSDPYIAKALFHYTKTTKLSPNFLTTWNHFKFIGLPPEPTNRPTLEAKTELYMKEPEGGLKMAFNMDDEDGTESSPTRLTAGNDESATIAMTGLTSRASRPGSATQGAGLLPNIGDD